MGEHSLVPHKNHQCSSLTEGKNWRDSYLHISSKAIPFHKALDYIDYFPYDHSLGKGEVVSSILTGSTRKALRI
jgi:hypothetical protein